MDTFGFTEVETYLIQAPPWFVAYIITLVVSWHSGRKLEHCVSDLVDTATKSGHKC